MFFDNSLHTFALPFQCVTAGRDKLASSKTGAYSFLSHPGCWKYVGFAFILQKTIDISITTLFYPLQLGIMCFPHKMWNIEKGFWTHFSTFHFLLFRSLASQSVILTGLRRLAQSTSRSLEMWVLLTVLTGVLIWDCVMLYAFLMQYAVSLLIATWKF